MRNIAAYFFLSLSVILSFNVQAQTIRLRCGLAGFSLSEDQFAGLINREEKRNIVLNDIAKHNTPLETTSLACDTLPTILTGNNGHDGIMFNITALKWITVTQFSAHVNPVTSGYMKIYYKQWTWQDTTATPADWTFIDSAMVTSSGNGVATLIPINVNVTIPAGNTVAFYITGTGAPRLVYSNGTEEDAVHVADSALQVKQGAGVAYPFGAIYTPRIFNGEVFYCEAPVSVQGEQASANNISLHPNPFSDITMLSFDKTVNNAVVCIYDVLGKEVKRISAVSTDKMEINRDDMKSGIYFIHISFNGKPAAVRRMIVE